MVGARSPHLRQPGVNVTASAASIVRSARNQAERSTCEISKTRWCFARSVLSARVQLRHRNLAGDLTRIAETLSHSLRPALARMRFMSEGGQPVSWIPSNPWWGETYYEPSPVDNEIMTPQRWDLRPSANHFTLLRLLLAVLVIVVHSFTLLVPLAERAPVHWAVVLGDLAVSGFFAVSGCLISASWARSPNFGAYLRKRVLRIYPGYLAAGIVCALGFAALGVPDARAYYASLRACR